MHKKFTILSKITSKIWGNKHKQSVFILPIVIIKSKINGVARYLSEKGPLPQIVT